MGGATPARGRRSSAPGATTPPDNNRALERHSARSSAKAISRNDHTHLAVWRCSDVGWIRRYAPQSTSDLPKVDCATLIHPTRFGKVFIGNHLKNPRNIPINIFGNNILRMTETRRRYELLFGLLLNSGLRISEALGLKISDVRLVDGAAKSVRVIGKGDKERLVPLPASFGAVFGFWLKDRNRTEMVFAKADGKPISPQAARAYLRGMLQKAGIEKKISPHQLRHTYATHRLNAGQIYTNVGQARMERVVGRL